MVEQRNYFKLHDKVEIFSPVHKNLYFEIDKIYNEDKELVEKANHPMEILYIPVPEKVFLNDMGRKVK